MQHASISWFKEKDGEAIPRKLDCLEFPEPTKIRNFTKVQKEKEASFVFCN